MMISTRYRHLSPPAALDQDIEDSLLPLGDYCRLDEAEVVIERRTDRSPASFAKVKVAVPGPDITVEAADHTSENNYRRAVSEVDRRLSDRKVRLARHRINGLKHANNFRTGRLRRGSVRVRPD